ncbi:methyltransferase [Thermocrinis sp.]|uniref:tRNA1(Val) (adenine(37)-N6)-methyltransferase n=1 Tax=Thermocrinis sp. TaxID=2024383 RepID=UPI002FDC7B6B
MEGFREFDFFRGKVKFIQPKAHRLSVVEILFVWSIKGIKRKSLVADLGAGFGALSILIALKYNCKVIAVEKDHTMIQLLKQNVKNNNLEDRIEVLECDVRKINQFLERQSLDCVVINPPFYEKPSANPYHTEIDGTLGDFLESASYILKDGGFINILLPSYRLLEACGVMESLNIRPMYLKFFHPFIDRHAKLVRIVGVKNLKPKLIVESPLIINHKQNKYTEEVQRILENFL